MLKNSHSIKIKSVGQFILPLVFIGCLFGIIYHIGVHFYGTDVILRVYGIQNENTLFDKSYKEFEFDLDDGDNFTKVRFIIYKENQSDDILKGIVLSYSEKWRDLNEVTSLELHEEKFAVNNYRVSVYKDSPLKIYIDDDKENIKFQFIQYGNVNPDDVRGDYTYEEYYLNSLNSFWIDMKIEDTIEIDKNMNLEENQLYSKNISEEKAIVINEVIRSTD